MDFVMKLSEEAGPRYEYRTEAIPAQPASRTTELLNRFAGEGWRVVTASVVPGPPDLINGGVQLALLVILEREKQNEYGTSPAQAHSA
jgi:hypothetical protein